MLLMVARNSLIHKEKQAASEAKAKVDEKALSKAKASPASTTSAGRGVSLTNLS